MEQNRLPSDIKEMVNASVQLCADYHNDLCPHIAVRAAVKPWAEKYAALRAKADKMERVLRSFTELSQVVGQPGCTWGDSDYDSMSAAAGYNHAIDYVALLARKALEQEGETKLTPEQIAERKEAIDWYRNPESEKEPVSQQVEKDDWISVEDQLPEEGGRYWCYVEEVNSLGISHFQWNCFYHEKENRWSDNFVSFNVTHWRKLPAPPKKEVSNG